MSHRAGLDQSTVVEEAARLVDEEGIDELTLGRVAERLGVRTPSLYNHVAGLPGLKRDLAQYCVRDLLDHLVRTTIGKSGAEAIVALAWTYRTYAREKPGRYAFTQVAPAADDRELVELARQIVYVLQAVLAPFQLSEEEGIHAIRALRSIVHGFTTLEMGGGFGLPVDLDASFDWLITRFIDSLGQSLP